MANLSKRAELKKPVYADKIISADFYSMANKVNHNRFNINKNKKYKYYIKNKLTLHYLTD